MPTVSVVVNTYNRAASLRVTLESLRQLDYPCFEVVAVNGPSTDDTEQVLAEYAGRIKIARCPERNLSVSRNIGVAQAAGDIVAFIDDDAYPDPAWLDRLATAYGNDEVAGAGGPVYDHTGAQLQSRYIVSDRVGRSLLHFDSNPSAWLNVPGAPLFPSLLGTNSSFRRNRLIDIGGFDEEFEYYLDETDVCARLIDAGFMISQLEDGFVYHKFLPNDIRGESRAVHDRYTVTKNTCYFALKNVREGSSLYDACVALADFVLAQRRDYARDIADGLLRPEDLAKFEVDMPAAFSEGWEHFLAGAPKTRPKEWFDAARQPFLPFTTVRPREAKLHVCLVSQDYPPAPVGGIGRSVHALATGLADAGHVVRVITKGTDADRVDLEDGVWVHRIVRGRHPAPEGIGVPQPLWDHAASVLGELRRIHQHRAIDIVQVPNWDAEGLAVLLDGTLRTVVGLYTPMKTVQRLDPVVAADPVAGQIAECERLCYQHGSAFLADSRAIVSEIETRYEVQLPTESLVVIPPGLSDRAAAAADAADAAAGAAAEWPHPLPEEGAPLSGTPIFRKSSRRRVAPPRAPDAAAADELVILFVGRLEARKGVDTLLACLPALLEEFPAVSVVLAGQDDLPGVAGVSPRAAFEASPNGRCLANRVHFLAAVADDLLDRLYADCDIFVAPSRFESFGLILLEAMMFAKPVVSCAVGGIPEVVEHGASGLLVPPGDAGALGHALTTLCRSPELRRRLGRRGRAIYEERFTAERAASRTNQFYDRLTGRSTTTENVSR